MNDVRFMVLPCLCRGGFMCACSCILPTF